jgi:hypothetical protein
MRNFADQYGFCRLTGDKSLPFPYGDKSQNPYGDKS